MHNSINKYISNNSNNSTYPSIQNKQIITTANHNVTHNQQYNRQKVETLYTNNNNKNNNNTNLHTQVLTITNNYKSIKDKLNNTRYKYRS